MNKRKTGSLWVTTNPDWAIIKQSNNETPKLVLVRETKGTIDESNMRKNEVDKIHCGTKHYSLLGVDYKVIVSANDLYLFFIKHENCSGLTTMKRLTREEFISRATAVVVGRNSNTRVG